LVSSALWYTKNTGIKTILHIKYLAKFKISENFENEGNTKFRDKQV